MAQIKRATPGQDYYQRKRAEGKPTTKVDATSDRNGLPLTALIFTATTDDSQPLVPSHA